MYADSIASMPRERTLLTPAELLVKGAPSNPGNRPCGPLAFRRQARLFAVGQQLAESCKTALQLPRRKAAIQTPIGFKLSTAHRTAGRGRQYELGRGSFLAAEFQRPVFGFEFGLLRGYSRPTADAGISNNRMTAYARSGLSRISWMAVAQCTVSVCGEAKVCALVYQFGAQALSSRTCPGA